MPESKRGTAAAAPRLPEDLRAVSATLFRRNGYAQTSTRALAEALGLQKASLYHYISTKEDLLYDLCVVSLDRITSQVDEAIRGLSPTSQLSALVVAHLVSILENRDMHAVMLTELRGLSGERRSDVVRRRDDYEDLVERVIAESQDAGVVRTDISSKHLTLALLNLLNWTIFWYSPTGELSAESLANLLESVLMDGARQPGSRARGSSRRPMPVDQAH